MSSLSSAAAPVRPAGAPVRVSHLGDELLARQASHGSERAFTALYERYHQPLYRYCRSILRNDADSQDALQSTFTGALQALRRGQRNAPLRPWLYRIAHNESISLLRRRSRTAADELDADSLGVGASVEQEAADRARWQSLVEDLGRLPDRQRGALLLRELSGLSHEEIAIALGTSTAGAKQAIFEARQALVELKEGRAMSCDEVRQRVSEGDRRMLRGRRVRAHLHACAACEAFALAIPERRNQLMAFAPVLAPSAAAAVLSRSMHAASAQGGAGGASAAAGAGAATKTFGTAVLWKGLAAVAVIATSVAGVTGIRHLLTPSRTAARASSAQLGHAGSRRASKRHVAVTAKHRRGSSALAGRGARARHANRYAAADRGARASSAAGSGRGAAAISGRTSTQPAVGARPAQGATAAGGAPNTASQGGGGSEGQQGGGGSQGGNTQGQQGGGSQGQQGGGSQGGNSQGQQGGGGSQGGGSQGQQGGGGSQGGTTQGQQGGGGQGGNTQGQQGGGGQGGNTQGQQGGGSQGGNTQGQQGGGGQGQQGGGGGQGQQGGNTQGQQGGGSQGGNSQGQQGGGGQGQQGGNR